MTGREKCRAGEKDPRETGVLPLETMTARTKASRTRSKNNQQRAESRSKRPREGQKATSNKPE
jgi:hypothetical protein